MDIGPSILVGGGNEFNTSDGGAKIGISNNSFWNGLHRYIVFANDIL